MSERKRAPAPGQTSYIRKDEGGRIRFCLSVEAQLEIRAKERESVVAGYKKEKEIQDDDKIEKEIANTHGSPDEIYRSVN